MSCWAEVEREHTKRITKIEIAWRDAAVRSASKETSRSRSYLLSCTVYQREPLECLSPGSGYEPIVQMWSSQTGKTQNALWFAAYHIQHDPAPILFVEPDENLAKTIAKDRI